MAEPSHPPASEAPLPSGDGGALREDRLTDPLRQIRHDLRASLGAATTTLEVLEMMEASPRPVTPEKRLEMVRRAIEALRQAERRVTDLEEVGPQPNA